MGRGLRCVYRLIIALGSILIFVREQELEALKTVFWVSLPLAAIWGCWTISRLLFAGAGSMFADARITLSAVIEHPNLPNRLKIAAGLAAVMVASFLYFAGMVDWDSSSGLQNSYLATP
jgi:hypothetical protein